jgi:N-acetylglucosaminyldiphosphoundecaprenol N-acetyl-beta-D-mannosaminyltransferase
MSIDVFGVPVATGPPTAVFDELRSWISVGRRSYVCCANVHVVETAQRDPTLAHALRTAGIVIADGAPIAWLASARSGVRTPRIAGADLFEHLCRCGGYRHFLLGSTPETLGLLEREMRMRFGAEVVGTHSPPFRDLSDTDVQAMAVAVNRADADIVWVGMGAPRQELLMQRLRPLIEPSILAGVGAVFDFYAGARTRAPIWMQSVGLEWLYRLAREPARLWRRYLGTNTRFVVHIIRSRAGKSFR